MSSRKCPCRADVWKVFSSVRKSVSSGGFCWNPSRAGGTREGQTEDRVTDLRSSHPQLPALWTAICVWAWFQTQPNCVTSPVLSNARCPAGRPGVPVPLRTARTKLGGRVGGRANDQLQEMFLRCMSCRWRRADSRY